MHTTSCCNVFFVSRSQGFGFAPPTLLARPGRVAPTPLRFVPRCAARISVTSRQRREKKQRPKGQKTRNDRKCVAHNTEAARGKGKSNA